MPEQVDGYCMWCQYLSWKQRCENAEEELKQAQEENTNLKDELRILRDIERGIDIADLSTRAISPVFTLLKTTSTHNIENEPREFCGWSIDTGKTTYGTIKSLFHALVKDQKDER